MKPTQAHIPKEGETAQRFTINVDSHIETNAVNEDGEDVPSGIRHDGPLLTGVRYWICEGR